MNCKINLYAIHDKKAKTYETPFALPNNAYAVRSFQDAVSKDTPYNKYAQDFELVHLGVYDQETGELKSLPEPAILVQASDLKPAETK